MWDGTDPLAGNYVICLPHPTEEHSAWCHQLRARFDTPPGIQIGLPLHHPFGGGGGGAGAPGASQVDPPPPGVVTFCIDGVRPQTDVAALGRDLTAAFTAHTERLGKESAGPRLWRARALAARRAARGSSTV